MLIKIRLTYLSNKGAFNVYLSKSSISSNKCLKLFLFTDRIWFYRFGNVENLDKFLNLSLKFPIDLRVRYIKRRNYKGMEKKMKKTNKIRRLQDFIFINLNLKSTIFHCLLVFVLTILVGVDYGLTQSGTELPFNVNQRSDGSIEFEPPFREEIIVNEQMPSQETQKAPGQEAQTENPSSQQSAQNVTSSQQGQTCEKLSHCDPDEIRVADVCFFQRRMMFDYYEGGGSSNTSVSELCPPDEGDPEILHFKFYVNRGSVDTLFEKLDEVANRCVRIRSLYFITGGYSGSTGIGLNNRNVTGLSSYSCLMTENAIVDLSGSPIGKGCTGKLLMQRVAENLFQNKPGTVISPNQTVVSRIGVQATARPSLAPSMVNVTRGAFGYNELRYTPRASGSPQLSWRNLDNTSTSYRDTIMRGLATEARPDPHSTLQEACKHNIEETIASIRRRQNELTDNRGRECPILKHCRRTPYNNVIREARSVASRLAPDSTSSSLQQAGHTYSQLLSIEGVNVVTRHNIEDVTYLVF